MKTPDQIAAEFRAAADRLEGALLDLYVFQVEHAARFGPLEASEHARTISALAPGLPIYVAALRSEARLIAAPPPPPTPVLDPARMMAAMATPPAPPEDAP